MPRMLSAIALALCLAGPQQPDAAPQGPFFADGIKVGEATSDSARVWVRLTRDAEANHDGVPFPQRKPAEPQLPEGRRLDEMEGAVPGAAGQVRVRYWPDGSDDEASQTAWTDARAEADFCHTFALTGLRAGTCYRLEVEARPQEASPSDGRATATVHGAFRTAPVAHAAHATSFCVIACQDHPRRDEGEEGHAIYRHMLALAPDFLVHTGDTIYYDKAKPFARDVTMARFKWNRFYGLRLPQRFHAHVATWFVKDDHDTLKDDCWPGQRYGDLTFEQGLAIYKEQLPVGPRPYRRQRYGRHLEIWLPEGREFRSENRMADGPDKTILGAEQKAWLKRTLAASDATFRVVISATPIVGPDRQSKNDNHANAGFAHEGDELRAFLAGQPGTIVICGDRHWQYASHDLTTGLREWGCGPASDAHAGGFRMDQRTDEHDYLKICGGFLHADLLLDGDRPRLRLSHRAVDGTVNHEDLLDAPDR